MTGSHEHVYVDFIYNNIVNLVSKLKDQQFLRKKVGMSSSNSFSSTHSKASTSTPLEIRDGQYESENLIEKSHDEGTQGSQDGENYYMDAYSDEPVADENWLQEYYRRREEEAEKVKELQLRWNESKPVTSW